MDTLISAWESCSLWSDFLTSVWFRHCRLLSGDGKVGRRMDDWFTHHALPLPTGMLVVFCTWALTQSLSYSSTPPVATLSGLGSSISPTQAWASWQALSIIAFLFTLSAPLSTASQLFSEIVHLPFQGLSRCTHLLTLPPVPSCWPVCWSLDLPGTTSSGSLSLEHSCSWCPGDLLYRFKSKVLCSVRPTVSKSDIFFPWNFFCTTYISLICFFVHVFLIIK